MASIDIRLRELMKQNSFFGLIRPDGYTGMDHSGPWILPIIGMVIIGLVNANQSSSSLSVSEFQISVTYLVVFSLLLTSPLQLLFTHFIADQLSQNKQSTVLPNVLGMMLLVITLSGILGGLILISFFSGSLIYRLLMLMGFVILSAIWILISLLSGLKTYRRILMVILLGYGNTVVAMTQLQTVSLEGLMGGFIVGHSLLLFTLLNLVLRSYSSTQLIAFDFLKNKQIILNLALTGFLYNLAIWIDKLIFWFNPQTSASIIEPLRASEVYDTPIFLAYLSIIPGIVIFLLRIKTDFSEKYAMFYQSINDGEPLHQIKKLYREMSDVAHRGVQDICKVQGITILILLLIGDKLLSWFGILSNYRLQFSIDLIAVGVQVILLVILYLLFYFNERLLVLCLLFVVFNSMLTLLTLKLDPSFYGSGFAVAVILTALTGFYLVLQKLDRISYETLILDKIQ
jgi:uncharacterized membrane protein